MSGESGIDVCTELGLELVEEAIAFQLARYQLFQLIQGRIRGGCEVATERGERQQRESVCE